ncbi:type I restriction enzyme HsdR N-terminal domain-containing protein [Archangium gephyra]|nr:type I restriction enzyme HsdR N-terminal domain-containing protein [Archangium gephyra]
MNEATFEASLHAFLARAFPAIAGARITHQTSFSLRFGHHNVQVDGDIKAQARGRLDVLISIDGRPVLLLELKAPDQALTAEDNAQALSYARLLTPMPPLYAVSNGTTTQIFQTSNKNPWEPATLDEQTVDSLLRQALVSAAADRDEAVMLLLGRNPALWRSIVADETADTLERLAGLPHDFTQPIVRSFQIPREATGVIRDLLQKSTPVVVLTGPPLSGRTNVAAELCRAPGEGTAALFLDATSLRHGIWQQISNMFAARLFMVASADDARRWVATSLRQVRGFRLVLVIDGWIPHDDDRVREAVDELVGFAELGNLHLVLTLEENQFERLRRAAGRPTVTPLGRIARHVELPSLTDGEFSSAMELMFQHFGAEFYPGAQHNRELRAPRLLRVIGASVESQGISRSSPIGGLAIITRVRPITDVGLLDEAWKELMPTPELRADLQRLALAFLEAPVPAAPEVAIISEQLGRTAVQLEVAEGVLGEERLRRLEEQGYVRLVERGSARFFILVKIPELLAAAASILIANRLASETDDAVIYQRFLIETQRFPLSDVVGARTLWLLGHQAPPRFSSLFYALFDDSPEEAPLDERDHVSLVTGDASIPLKVSHPTAQRTLGNTHPWLVLSHLAEFPMGTDMEGSSPNVSIFEEIGATPYPLQRSDTVILEDMRPLHIHHFHGGMSFFCRQDGLVEPITQAMLLHLFFAPAEMVSLVERAVKNDLVHLVWRLWTAADEALSAVDEESAAAASGISEKCRAYWIEKFGVDAEH